jgi:hypothetical protein
LEIIGEFFGFGGRDELKFHLVNYNTMYLSVRKAGLGCASWVVLTKPCWANGMVVWGKRYPFLKMGYFNEI